MGQRVRIGARIGTQLVFRRARREYGSAYICQCLTGTHSDDCSASVNAGGYWSIKGDVRVWVAPSGTTVAAERHFKARAKRVRVREVAESQESISAELRATMPVIARNEL